MDIPQERKLVTEIPGPRVPRVVRTPRERPSPPGVGDIHPIVTARASGAIVEDVDGNRLIDFATGIAVLNVGHTAPEVVAAVQRQAELDTHTCFHVTANEPYIELAERLNALTPGDGAEEDDVRQLRRRGGRERGEDRAQGHRSLGDRDVRPRVPRPHAARRCPSPRR